MVSKFISSRSTRLTSYLVASMMSNVRKQRNRMRAPTIIHHRAIPKNRNAERENGKLKNFVRRKPLTTPIMGQQRNRESHRRRQYNNLRTAILNTACHKPLMPTRNILHLRQAIFLMRQFSTTPTLHQFITLLMLHHFRKIRHISNLLHNLVTLHNSQARLLP